MLSLSLSHLWRPRSNASGREKSEDLANDSICWNDRRFAINFDAFREEKAAVESSNAPPAKNCDLAKWNWGRMKAGDGVCACLGSFSGEDNWVGKVEMQLLGLARFGSFAEASGRSLNKTGSDWPLNRERWQKIPEASIKRGGEGTNPNSEQMLALIAAKLRDVYLWCPTLTECRCSQDIRGLKVFVFTFGIFR